MCLTKPSLVSQVSSHGKPLMSEHAALPALPACRLSNYGVPLAYKSAYKK